MYLNSYLHANVENIVIYVKFPHFKLTIKGSYYIIQVIKIKRLDVYGRSVGTKKTSNSDFSF